MNMNPVPEQRDNQGAGAVADAGENARFDINQMVDRLRDFLTNIDQNFPALGNVENPEIEENNEDQNDLDEFD